MAKKMSDARTARIKNLEAWGFLPHESKPLSVIENPLKPPYFKALIERRADLYKKEYLARVKAETQRIIKWWMLPGRRARVRTEVRSRCQARYEKLIREWYKANGWVKKIGRKTFSDVWAMYKSLESGYKDKHPKYDSPLKATRRRARAAISQDTRKAYGRHRAKTPPVGEVVFNKRTGRYEPRYF